MKPRRPSCLTSERRVTQKIIANRIKSWALLVAFGLFISLNRTDEDATNTTQLFFSNEKLYKNFLDLQLIFVQKRSQLIEFEL